MAPILAQPPLGRRAMVVAVGTRAQNIDVATSIRVVVIILIKVARRVRKVVGRFGDVRTVEILVLVAVTEAPVGAVRFELAVHELRGTSVPSDGVTATVAIVLATTDSWCTALEVGPEVAVRVFFSVFKHRSVMVA